MSYNDRLIRASFKQQVDRVPVWYMRQAGRYDPEYRKIKEKYSLLEICRRPELAAEVTLMPVRKLGVDAAILYSDIMNPVASLGIDFDIVKILVPLLITLYVRREMWIVCVRLMSRGPVAYFGNHSDSGQGIGCSLITFAGAPFTIASYLIEGRPSKGYIRTKTMMYSEPEVWHKLMQKLGDMVITYVRAHIANGGKAFQLFDSWVGALSPNDFKTYVLPTITRIFTELSDLNVPKIYFPGVASGELLPTLTDLQANVIGLDWRVSITEGRKRLGGKFAVQGNLDPYVLTAPMDLIKQQAKVIIDEGIKEPGYIFNLGHGLFPEASLEKLRELTAYIHEYSAEVLKTG